MGSEQRNILVTGGAGFIGTHCVLLLLNEGFRVVIIDNLDNSCQEAVNRVRILVGPEKSRNLDFHLGDLRNKEDIEKLFSEYIFDAVIHFAGLKAVGESVAYPFRYFDNNLIGSINLYQVMSKYNCKKSNRFPEWWGDRPRTLEEYRRFQANRGPGSSRGGGVGHSTSTTVHANAVFSGSIY